MTVTENLPAARTHSWDRPLVQFYQMQLCRRLIRRLSLCGRFPLEGRRILDVGCGAGKWLLEFAQWGADGRDLCGIDIDAARIGEARRKLPGSDLRTGSADLLPWPDRSFDVVTQFVLFTSILDDSVQERAAAEMSRVVKPGGLIVWYDFRFDNPWNDRVRGVTARRIRELFAGWRVELHSATLAPPLARRVVPLSWTAALLLESLPFLRTHYLALIAWPE